MNLTPQNTLLAYPGHSTGAFRNLGAFAVIKSDGSVITWGGSAYGGNSISTAGQINGQIKVTQVVSSQWAFAALRTNGSVVSWGFTGANDYQPINITSTFHAQQIFANASAFSAILADGSVTTWGGRGADTSAVAGQLNGTVPVVQIYTSESAFSALRTDGSIVSWGQYLDSTSGVFKPINTLITNAPPSVAIMATQNAFAALRQDGSVITWGDATNGGDSGSVMAQLNGTIPVSQIFSNQRAFSALRADGSVVCWGEATAGADNSPAAGQLNGAIPVTTIVSTNSAFSALRADGSVVTWGNSTQGGDSTAVMAQLNGTVKITQLSATSSAFSALRADGSVITWGNSTQGGDSTAVKAQLNGTIPVTALFATGSAFSALRTDGSVVTWGDGIVINSQLDTQLNGSVPVTQIFTSGNAFSALRIDGSVVTWGHADFGGDSSAVANQLASGVVSFASLTNNGKLYWGSAANDVLTGGIGNDIFLGKAGIDTLIGGLGNDTYYIDNPKDKIIEADNAGLDTVYTSVNFTLPANVENLVLQGASNISGTGNALNNVITGNTGTGALSGGIGDDTYLVNNTSTRILEDVNAGTDTVESTVNYTLPVNVENLTLKGSSAINGTGNALDNVLIGNTARNTLSGGIGNDTLIGGGGGDILRGGLGADILNVTEPAGYLNADTVVIAAGDSPLTAYDSVIGLHTATGSLTGSLSDKLDLPSTKIASNAISIDGIDAGLIKSHQITNGIISFSTANSFNSAIALNSVNLADAIKYVQSNITALGTTVAFNTDTSAYVFQDGGSSIKDTLVELIGVHVNSLNTTGIGAGALWLV